MNACFRTLRRLLVAPLALSALSLACNTDVDLLALRPAADGGTVRVSDAAPPSALSILDPSSCTPPNVFFQQSALAGCANGSCVVQYEADGSGGRVAVDAPEVRRVLGATDTAIVTLEFDVVRGVFVVRRRSPDGQFAPAELLALSKWSQVLSVQEGSELYLASADTPPDETSSGQVARVNLDSGNVKVLPYAPTTFASDDTGPIERLYFSAPHLYLIGSHGIVFRKASPASDSDATAPGVVVSAEYRGGQIGDLVATADQMFWSEKLADGAIAALQRGTRLGAGKPRTLIPFVHGVSASNPATLAAASSGGLALSGNSTRLFLNDSDTLWRVNIDGTGLEAAFNIGASFPASGRYMRGRLASRNEPGEGDTLLADAPCDSSASSGVPNTWFSSPFVLRRTGQSNTATWLHAEPGYPAAPVFPAARYEAGLVGTGRYVYVLDTKS